MSHGGSVNIVTELRAGQPGFDSRQEKLRDLFSSPQRPDRLWGIPNVLSMDTGGSFPGGKAAG
jgi:hypothetical protein